MAGMGENHATTSRRNQETRNSAASTKFLDLRFINFCLDWEDETTRNCEGKECVTVVANNVEIQLWLSGRRVSITDEF